MQLSILKELGFSEKEVSVYTAILEQDRLTPAEIARSTGIERTTVYSVIKTLTDKGLITEDHVKKHTYVTALPLSSLSDMISKEEREIENRKLLAKQAIDKLETIVKHQKSSIPKLTFIYEENLKDFMYKLTPEWNKSIMRRDGVWWGFQNTGFVRSYQDWINWYWQTQSPDKMVLRLLTNESEFEKRIRAQGYTRRLTKFWNGGKDFTAAMWICGDYIIMIATDQKPHYLVQIHDETMAHNMREMFKSIWEAQE